MMSAFAPSQPSPRSRGRLRLGVDIGGTKTAAVAADTAGTVVASARVRTDTSPEGVVRSVLAAMDGLGTSRHDGEPVSIGIPGMLNRSDGTVRNAVHLGIGDKPLNLVKELAAHGVSATIENDVTCATWGVSSVLGLNDFAFLSLGTGIAVGLVLGGVLRRGATGTAGEIGHLAVDPTGEPCRCGQRGCLETLSSGSALERAWPGGQAAVELLSADDGACDRRRASRDRFLCGLRLLVRTVAQTTDPATIVIGGGIANAGQPLLNALQSQLRSEASTSPFLRDLALDQRLRLAPSDVPVGALGAALLRGIPHQGGM